MPRVTDDHLAARRRQILDGARRCFAEYGYDKATVRRLEQTIGLSRGAIFHHFRDKDTLFFELAHEDAERMANVASREGLVQVMRDMLAAPEEFDWLATRLESHASCVTIRRSTAAGRSARRSCRRRPPRACANRSKLDGCETMCPARFCRRTWTWSSTAWSRGWRPATTPKSSVGYWTSSRPRFASSSGQLARLLRWFGPPRLRIVVPDSRSMLWIEPYERPVVATSVRMLAPPS
jgi:AcrR family transcriptional regulator